MDHDLRCLGKLFRFFQLRRLLFLPAQQTFDLFPHRPVGPLSRRPLVDHFEQMALELRLTCFGTGSFKVGELTKARCL